MHYEKFRQFLQQRHRQSFVDLCIRRASLVENAYGRSIDELVQNDVTMQKALVDLEWRVGKDDLDNYQNTLRHYYEMLHGHKFPMRIMGNRRFRNE